MTQFPRFGIFYKTENIIHTGHGLKICIIMQTKADQRFRHGRVQG